MSEQATTIPISEIIIDQAGKLRRENRLLWLGLAWQNCTCDPSRVSEVDADQHEYRCRYRRVSQAIREELAL